MKGGAKKELGIDIDQAVEGGMSEQESCKKRRSSASTQKAFEFHSLSCDTSDSHCPINIQLMILWCHSLSLLPEALNGQLPSHLMQLANAILVFTYSEVKKSESCNQYDFYQTQVQLLPCLVTQEQVLLLNFAQIVGFVKLVKGVPCISCPLLNKTKLKFDQDIKAC